MENRKSLLALLAVFSCTVAVRSLAADGAYPGGKPSELPNFDKRPRQAAAAIEARDPHRVALAALREKTPRVQVDLDEFTGSPKWISVPGGFLTAAEGTGAPIAPATLGAFRANDPHRVIKAYVNQHAALFGHGAAELEQARVERDFVTEHNGLRTVAWEQSFEGVPVYQGIFIGHITSRGELVNVSDRFVARLSEAVERGVPDRRRWLARPPISAAEALVRAAANIGDKLDPATIVVPPEGTQGMEQRQELRAPALKGAARLNLVWLPMTRASVRLAWQVEFTSRSRGELFRMLIDLERGEVLVRHRLTYYLSEATYRVFTRDSPSPFSPGHLTLSDLQPLLLERERVTLSALSTNASPKGWIDDGANELRGNNVDAHLDRNDDDVADTPRVQGSPARVFDFPLDLARGPSTYGSAAVTELFYWNNWMHDRLYDLGFTEAAGNFQKTNFNRGGIGNDAVQADAQDGGGLNNANFSTPSDGSAGRMQMYVFNGPTPDRDGTFDTEVLLHEYTHGLSGRLVGAGVGIFELQPAGMGEGWSDFYPLALLSEAGDQADGVYAFGGYSSHLFDKLTQNYYFGIRRYPYSTDLTKNPLTFKDADSRQADAHLGIPMNPIFEELSFAEEVHNLGEIWCVTLWEARANLIHKLGFETGNQLILQLVTDGMKLSPPNPTFLQARDAIIQAELVKSAGANREELWRAFAKRGLGFNATCPRSSTTAGIVESFDVPDDLRVTPNSSFTANGPIGGAFQPAAQVFTLANASTNVVRWSVSKSAAWFDLSASDGTIAAGSPPISVAITLNDVASDLPAGTYTDAVTFTNHVTGRSQTRAVSLRAGQPDFFTKLFDEEQTDAPQFQSLTFTPDGSAAFYSACREESTGFPTDPSAGIVLPLSDDEGTELTLTDGAKVSFFGTNYPTLFLSANGYLTFTHAVSEFQKSIEAHFKTPRLSMLFDDLDPSFGGLVTWLQLPDRVAITFESVPHFFGFEPSTFQAELFFDGRIRLTYHEIAEAGGLIGLSRGGGVPAGFVPTKFDRFGACLPALEVRLPASAVESAGELNGVVSIPGPLNEDLVVALLSIDPAKAREPDAVTIRRGETTAAFTFQPVNNPALTGTRVTRITASAPGFRDGSGIIQILDHELATLTVTVPSEAAEGDGLLRLQGTVSLNQPPNRSVVVQLSSSDTNEVTVPGVVVISAGQTSARFDLTVVDDARIDGVSSSRIQAHVGGWSEVPGSIAVRDNELKTLSIVAIPRVGEGNGLRRAAGEVRIPGTLTNDLGVTLSSSDATELTVPLTVVVPRGLTFAKFDLNVMDDSDVDGAQLVTISASAPGFTNAVASVVVNDNETPPVPAGPSPAHLSTNASPNLTLAWSTGEGELIVNGGFETGDFSGWGEEATGSGGFVVNDGKLDPAGPEEPSAPYAGKFGVVSEQTGPSRNRLYQDVTIATGAISALLTWNDRVRNHASGFVEQDQQFRVEICSTNNQVLAVAFATQPGDALLQDWTPRSYDLAAFIGQTIRIAFVEEDNLGHFNVGLDNVSVLLSQYGETAFEVYFGTNPAPGAAEFRGTTATNSWPLPRLEIDRTYFWQIVAVRGAARTAGPIWQFRVPPVGPLDHFAWNAIASPQVLNAPIPVTVTAQDVYDNLVTNFTGTAALAARVEFPDATIGEGTSTWEFPLGGFFEDARIQVVYPPEEVGARRRITALALYVAQPRSAPVNRFTIRMKHTPLRGYPTTPVWERTDWTTVYQKTQPVPERGWQTFTLTTPFEYDGVSSLMIDFSFKGNGFASGGDCRYTTTSERRSISFQSFGFDGDPLAWSGSASPAPNVTNAVPDVRLSASAEVSVAPQSAGPFVSGVWTGELRVLETASAVAFGVDDGEGHTGKGDAFEVLAQNDLSVTASAPPYVTWGQDFDLVFEVRNSGPTGATGVMLSSPLLPNAGLVLVRLSQGAVAGTNGTFTCALGAIPANGSATVRLTLQAGNVSGAITNTVRISRTEMEAYTANDSAQIVSTLSPPPTLLIEDIEVAEGNPGTTNTAVFTVRLSVPSGLPVAVDYRTSDATATNGTDYLGASGRLTFTPGQTAQTVSIQVNGDTADEIDETFTLALSAVTNATLARAQAKATIRDDDGPKISITDATVSEGNFGGTNAVFTVSLDQPSPQNVTVEYTISSGSASSDNDFESDDGTLIFAPGSTRQTIVVRIHSDTTTEPTERFFVTLFLPEGAALADHQAIGTIVNDDGLPGNLDHFVWGNVPSPQIVNEPFPVTLLALDAANRPATNYTGPALLSAATIRPEVAVGTGDEPWFEPMGTAWEDSRIQIIYRAAELGPARLLTALSLYVTNLPALPLTRWTIRMKPTLLNSYGSAPVWERTGWTVVFQKNQTITSRGWVTFRFAQPFAYDGKSNLLLDFSFNNNEYDFDEGECLSTVTDDVRAIWGSSDSFDGDPLNWLGQVPEPESRQQILNLRLESHMPVAVTPTNAGNFVNGVWSGEMTVQALAPSVALQAEDALGHTGRGNDFTLNLVNDLSLSVAVAPEAVTVSQPVTYTYTVYNSGPNPSSGLVFTNVIPSNGSFVSATSSQGVCSQISSGVKCLLGDLSATSNAVVTIVLKSPATPSVLISSATVARTERDTYLTNNRVTSQITVNPVPTILVTGSSVMEGTSATTNAIVSVRLSVPSSLPVSVDYKTVEVVAKENSDYLPGVGTLVFEPGVTNMPVAVTIIGDSLDETEETFQVILTNAVNATLMAAPALCRILDDDGPTITVNPAATLEGHSSTNHLVFNVRLSAASVQSIVVDYATTDDSANAGSDYLARSGWLAFLPGITNQVIIIPVKGDILIEPDESFLVELFNATNATVQAAPGTGRIVNDDGLPGELDHFNWSTLSSPQRATRPIPVTVFAQDSAGQPAVNFIDTAALEARALNPDRTIGTAPFDWVFPFEVSYGTARLQSIYLAKEIGAARRITSLALNVTKVPSVPLNRWTIRMKHTTLASYPARPVWEGAGWVLVYQSDDSIEETGWVTFNFTTPFEFNGTNNVLIDFSFLNGDSFVFSDGECSATGTTEPRSISSESFNFSEFTNDPFDWSGSVPQPDVHFQAPDIRLSSYSLLPLTPTNTTNFANGQWTGFLLIGQPASNVVLNATGRFGHSGASRAFGVIPWVDTDHDSLPDDWELANGFNATSPGEAAQDPDNDGMSNATEYVAGTNPRDSSSVLFLSLVRLPGGGIGLSFRTVSGKNYDIERTQRLDTPDWQPVIEEILGHGGVFESTMPASHETDATYYRIRVLP